MSFQQKSLRKGASLFNIDDDEDQDDEFGGLTHLGRSLDLEGAMQGAVGSGSEDEDDMDGDTIGATNFGGFDEGDRANKSRSEIMKEVIAKSKYYKLERQKLKDENEDLRRELDAEVDDVRSLLLAMNEPAKAAPLPGKSTAPSATSAPIVNAADYDSLVHQLAGEKRAKPQDRLKSEEELAVERKEKLERLEQDRQRRLLGLLPEDEAMGRARHRPETSGDYLEPAAAFEAMDDFDAGEAPQALTYRDGKLVSGDIFVKKARPGRDLATVRKSAGEEDGEGSEGEDSEEEGSDEEGSDEDDASGSDEGSGEEDSDGEEGSGDESDNSMEDDGAEDSDLEHEEGDIAAASDEEELEEAPEMEEERQRKEELREERRLAAMKELPYVFPAPETHEEFEGFVAGRPASDLDTVIGRLRSLYHIKLHADNRQKMDTLFGILMDHLAMAYGTTPADVEAGEVVVKHLRELAQERAEIAYSHAHGYLEELNLRIENALAKGSTKTVLGPSDIALLQLLGQLFPTSDLRHPITTPLQMIICRFLDLRLLRNTRDMTVGLALCNMVVDVGIFAAKSREFFGINLNNLARHSSRNYLSVLCRKSRGIWRIFCSRSSNVEAAPRWNLKAL